MLQNTCEKPTIDIAWFSPKNLLDKFNNNAMYSQYL